MQITKLSSMYEVRRLSEEDVDAVVRLCSGNPLFYEYHPPVANRQSILADMKALPPGKDYDDKFYLGFYDGTELVAVMDLILHFPADKIAYIGFFMMESKCQGHNVGTAIISVCVAYLKEIGFTKVRLGIDKGNPQSRAFWTKNEFVLLESNPDGPYQSMERVL